MPLIEQHLFIIGAPRSGTTWLQAMLAAHPLVCTTVELTLYNKYVAPWVEVWDKETKNLNLARWHQGLPFVWDEKDFYSFLAEFVERVYGTVHETKPHATHILDKHPGYSMYVAHINKILPASRFIHIIRDGRDVSVSMVAARKRIGFGTGTIQGSAAAWKRYVLAARQAEQYRGRYLEVRYEDLLRNGIETLKSVFEFCGVPTSPEQVETILAEHQFKRMKAKQQAAVETAHTSKGHYRKGRAGTWQNEMSSTERYIFYMMAGDLLRDLGYARKSWWVTSPLQRVVSPALATAIVLGRTARRRIFHASAELLGPKFAARIRAIRQERGAARTGG